jgi:hypothetical protein
MLSSLLDSILFVGEIPRTKLNLTRLKTVRDKSIKVTNDCSDDVSRINFALDIATSPESHE